MEATTLKAIAVNQPSSQFPLSRKKKGHTVSLRTLFGPMTVILIKITVSSGPKAQITFGISVVVNR